MNLGSHRNTVLEDYFRVSSLVFENHSKKLLFSPTRYEKAFYTDCKEKLLLLLQNIIQVQI